jgi:hypothetical protein
VGGRVSGGGEELLDEQSAHWFNNGDCGADERGEVDAEFGYGKVGLLDERKLYALEAERSRKSIEESTSFISSHHKRSEAITCDSSVFQPI